MSRSFLKRQKFRVERKLRILRRKDLEHRIGTSIAVLPPEHYLAYYQQDLPFYDRYFLEFLRRYASLNPDLCVIDIGANVGDTALAVLSAAPNARVICVEGSPYFLKYLQLNTSNFERVQVIEGFVIHRSSNWTLVTDNSTGHLVETYENGVPVGNWFAPRDVLAIAGPGGSQIWKSDTDGYDIAILLSSFDDIVQACEIVWIEFDPVGNLSDDRDIETLIARIGDLPRDVVIFDNFGHLLLRIPAQEAPNIVPQLNSWLAIQESGAGRFVGYFDLWILPPQMAKILADTAKQVPVT